MNVMRTLRSLIDFDVEIESIAMQWAILSTRAVPQAVNQGMNRSTNISKTLTSLHMQARLSDSSIEEAFQKEFSGAAEGFDIACFLLTKRGLCTRPLHAD